MSKVTKDMMLCFLKSFERRRFAEDGLQALLDAKLISLPVNEAAIRESVMRELRDAVDGVIHESDQYCPMRAEILACFDAPLPTKDRAEELVDAYCSEKLNYTPNSEERRSLLKTFRWLIEREGANG